MVERATRNCYLDLFLRVGKAMYEKGNEETSKSFSYLKLCGSAAAHMFKVQ